MSGIINTAQHCYFNSLTQCLANNEGILARLTEHRDRHTFPLGEFISSVVWAIIEVMKIQGDISK